MKVKVIKSENKFPRIMMNIHYERISIITHQGNKYYETILQNVNPINVGYHQEVLDLDHWKDFTGEIVLSN